MGPTEVKFQRATKKMFLVITALSTHPGVSTRSLVSSILEDSTVEIEKEQEIQM